MIEQAWRERQAGYALGIDFWMDSSLLSGRIEAMATISITDIQQNFASYFSRVQAGEVLVITDKGQPVAEIKPVATAPAGQRPFGLAAGEFCVPDNFSDPLPGDLLRDFESL